MKLFLFVLMAFSPNVFADKIQLALNWKAEPQFGGFYAAQINGHFKKAGLDIEIKEGGAGTPTVQMISAGTVPFAIVSADEIVLAHDRGAKIKALFASYQINPQCIMTHAERGFKTLADVFASPGILAIQRGLPYSEYLLKVMGKPKVQIVPYSGGISSFLQDKNFSQQCFQTSEPIAATRAGQKVKTFLISEAGYNPYTTVVAVQKSWFEKNKEVSKKFVFAVRQGWKDYLSAEEEINKAMHKFNPSMDSRTFSESALAQKPLILPAGMPSEQVGTMKEARWTELIGQLRDLKLIKKDVKANELFENI